MKTFYTLAITQTLSLVGSRMTAIAVGIWLYTTTGSATPLLLMAFFNELPAMLLGSLAGVLVDRWSRKHILVLADAGQAAATLALIAIFSRQDLQIWHLYAIALISGLFSTFQGPAEEAVITLLVPERQRDRANGIIQMAFPLAGVAAPALAGVIYTLSGTQGVLAVDLVTFLIAVLVVLLVKIPHPPASQESLAAANGFVRELRAGSGFLWQRKPLLRLVLFLTVINFLLNGPLTLSLPYLLAITGDKALTGSLLGIESLGALTGAALISAGARTQRRIFTILSGITLSGSMFLVYGTARAPALLGGALFFLFLPLPALNALTSSILQAKVPADMQGRIFSVHAQLGYLGSTTSFLLTGPILDRGLTPLLASGAWGWALPLVGDSSAAPYGLLLFLNGLLILACTALAWSSPTLLHLEKNLPDYAPQAAKD